MTKISSAIFKTFFLSLCIIANTHFAFAQTASILPQGYTQYLDSNGKPLSAGKVYNYIPSTTTPKTTWQDAAETIPNANPVILDAAGRAKILGDGSYRQIVKDRNNVTIWDAVTSSTGSGSSAPTATGDGDLVGTIKPWAGMTAPSQYAFTYGQEVSRTTYSALYTAITSSQSVFCNSGSPTLNGLSDTTNFWIGMSVEVTCVAAGFSTIISKTSSTVTLAANANVTANVTAIFYPWGRGNGTTTFNLPDLRGVVPAGNNNMGGVASANLTTTYFGTTDPNSAGALGGAQSKTLTSADSPSITPTGTVNTTLNILIGRTAYNIVGGVELVYSPSNVSGSAAPATQTATSTFSGIPQGGGIAVSAAVVAAGSGYTPGSQTITVSGGTCTTQPQFTVTVSGGGAFSGTPSLLTAGSCTVAPTNPAATTGGGGTGGTLNVTYSAQPFSLIPPTRTTNYIIKITPDTNSATASGVTALGGMTGSIACGTGLACTGNIISVNISGLPNHAVVLGTGGSSLNSTSPSATVGIPLVSNGSSADPSFNSAYTIREKLSANRNYYIRTDGNDNNNGLTDSAGGAFLTVNKCLQVVQLLIDANGYDVKCRVQGMGSSASYSENLKLGHWIGYIGNGFAQFTVLCENGTVTLTSPSASPVIFATQSGAPTQFEGCTTTNPAASGIQIEADDGAFIVLKTHTWGATGAGGIMNQGLLNARIILVAGTHTISGDSGVWAYATNNSIMISQPGVTVALGTGRLMSTSLVYLRSGSRFENTGIAFTGTLGGSVPYNIDYNTSTSISDYSVLSSISGAGAAVATAISVGSGGTGRLVRAPPTFQIFTSGTNATYTTPSGASAIEIEMVGGGGGGAGSGTTPGAATAGGDTCWNTSGTACTSPVYQAGGGAPGSTAGATTAAGGTVTGSGTCSDSQSGGTGGPGPIAASQAGGQGGASRYGGQGSGGWGGANNATSAAANSGSGGGGAGENATNNGGGGGGAGAFCRTIISSPAATYTYTIGSAGTAGTAGTGGNAGGGGGAGKIVVREYYN